MHYITLDTNTWIYLCNGTEPVKVLHFIVHEVQKGNITILLPEIIKKEWENHKEKDVRNFVSKSVDDVLKSLNRFSTMFEDKGKRGFLDSLLKNQESKEYFVEIIEKFKSKKTELNNAVNENIDLVDELFKSKAIIINGSPEVYTKCGEFAIAKKAPFVMKNSFADALIIFSLFEYIKANSISDAIFISYNTADFCKQENNIKTLHPHLIPEFLSANNCKYYKNVGEAINTIEKDIVTKEELELIELYQNYDEEELNYCDLCFEYNDYVSPIYWNGEFPLYNENNKDNPLQLDILFKDFQERRKITTTIEVGHCGRCGTEHFKCIYCGHVNAVLDDEYNETKQCERCEADYLIERHRDKDDISHTSYTIPKEYEVCEKCGDEFPVEEIVENICKKCEEEYSYGE